LLSITKAAHPIAARYPNAHLATALSKAEAMARLMDGLGYNCFWLAEHRFQSEGTECIPNAILMALHLARPSPEIWSETISGGEEVLAGNWGGLFWATSLEKIFGGVVAVISYRPGGWMQQSAVPRCANLSVGSTGGIGQ